MLGIGQLCHEMLKLRVIVIRDPVPGTESMDNRIHGAGCQEGDLLGVYAHIGVPRPPGDHIPVFLGQKKQVHTRVAI